MLTSCLVKLYRYMSFASHQSVNTPVRGCHEDSAQETTECVTGIVWMQPGPTDHQQSEVTAYICCIVNREQVMEDTHGDITD